MSARRWPGPVTIGPSAADIPRRRLARRRKRPTGMPLFERLLERAPLDTTPTPPAQDPPRRAARERPSTYEHPLAAAARAGRIPSRPPPMPIVDERQMRAYRVARARALAQRWGWKEQSLAILEGHDNRSIRRRFR